MPIQESGAVRLGEEGLYVAAQLGICLRKQRGALLPGSRASRMV
jgi:hypothetical protein